MHHLRAEYESLGIDVGDVDPDPLVQLDRWFSDAVEAGIAEANTMVLATATPDGSPSCRAVLLKGLDERGLVFFTSYASRKGRELADNPRAALVFVWIPLHRQVRVEGGVEQVSAGESDAYFATRPAGARLGAASSPQSEPIPDRGWLEQRVAMLAAEHPDGDVPRPSWWGGYRLVPTSVEFWQGRPDRLHDRVRYRRVASEWAVERLAP